MKKIFNAFLLAFISYVNLYAQNSEIEGIANTALKIFTWDIEKRDEGNLMYLDVPYARKDNSDFEYLTLTVAKANSSNRPEFISVILPNNIDTANGIFIHFANSVESKNGEMKMELVKGNPVRITIEKCMFDFCTARLVGGYLTVESTGKKIDIFEKFLTFDHGLFLFVYPDGSNKSVSVPLFSFKEQYKALNKTFN